MCCRLQAEMESNPDEWQRIKIERKLEEAREHMSKFVGSGSSDDVMLVDSTTRGQKRRF